MTASRLAHICQCPGVQISLAHSQTHKSTLLDPSYFAWQNPLIQKSNLWNWQGTSAASLVSLDHVTPHKEWRGENKTVRVSAIPTVIFITTTWVERKRERSQSTVKEVYHYKRFVKLTLVKLGFSHLEYKGMQSQEVKGRKQTARRVKTKGNLRGLKQKPEWEGTFTD